MTFTVPIFHDGEVVAFSCCMAHWPDVGGTLDGATTDIFSEGLQMPIVKIYRKGVPNEELISIIKTNVRLPERAMGDFRAQIAAVKTGERRFLEMIRKYGRDAVVGGIEAIMDHSEARARARVAQIPTASTKPSPSWTMTASGWASACRSACASRSRATR